MSCSVFKALSDEKTMIGWFLVICLLDSGLSELNTDLENGRAQYELLKRDATMPRFGTCWKEALSDLHSGCRSLTDDVQARLAIKFANCFLEKSGMKGYPCSEDKEVSACLEGISNNGFTTYSNFFTHTHNMCQFLQAQIWREKTEDTIQSLTDNSAHVAASLGESSKIQEKIMKSQIDTLEFQKQIIASGGLLSQAIEHSKSNIKDMLSEFRSSTDEQRMLIFSIFDRVAKLQNLVISEMSWLYTVLFYGIAMFVIYLVTATKRTADARLSIFLVLSINFVLERLICKSSLPDDSDFGGATSELINQRIWLLRKISISVSFSILVYFASTFKDYNLINHNLLQDISRQNLELSTAINALKMFHGSKDFTDFALKVDENQKELLFTNQEFDSDTDSFDSSQTDRTWTGNQGEDQDYSDDDVDNFFEEEEDFLTAANNSPCSSTSTTPTADKLPTSENGTTEDVLTPLSANFGGRTKKGRMSRRGSSAEKSLLSPNHSYNLRKRNPNSSFDNPILDSESPNSFGKLVSKLSHITQKNSLLIRDQFRHLQAGENPSAQQGTMHVFSSDEDN